MRNFNLWEIAGDVRTTIAAMLVRGTPPEQIALQTGASLNVVRLIAASRQ